MWATQSCPTLCDFIVCPWNSLGKHTGVGCHSLLQGTFPTQGWNPGLLPRRQTLYQPSHRGSIDDTGLWTIPQPPCRTAVPGTHSHSRLGGCALWSTSRPPTTPQFLADTGIFCFLGLGLFRFHVSVKSFLICLPLCRLFLGLLDTWSMHRDLLQTQELFAISLVYWYTNSVESGIPTEGIVTPQQTSFAALRNQKASFAVRGVERMLDNCLQSPKNAELKVIKQV